MGISVFQLLVVFVLIIVGWVMLSAGRRRQKRREAAGDGVQSQKQRSAPESGAPSTQSQQPAGDGKLFIFLGRVSIIIGILSGLATLYDVFFLRG